MADKSDATCQRASERFLLYRFREENYKDFLKKAENCWQFTNNIQIQGFLRCLRPRSSGQPLTAEGRKNFHKFESKITIWDFLLGYDQDEFDIRVSVLGNVEAIG